MALLKTNKHLRNRRVVDRGAPPRPTVANVVPTVSTTTLTLTSDVPVIWKGIPESLVVGSRTFSAFTVISPTVAHITLSATGAAQAYSMDANDPAIRTQSGGFANAFAGTFPS